MSHSAQTSQSTSSNANNNSGSQYATCALGVGLVALGIVMIIWSVVPTANTGNSSNPSFTDAKSNTSSIAFILVGAGVGMLLLSVCLGMRNKRRRERQGQGVEGHLSADTPNGDRTETQEEQNQRYEVPTYEEAVSSGQYPVRQGIPQNNSTSQLPTYEDLVEGVQIEVDGHGTADGQPQAGGQPSLGPAEASANRRNGRPGRKLLPLKIRRIKSEKLGRKNITSPPTPTVFNIEPLTPPPQYDDKVPQL
ncbi:transmembrane protein 51a [Chanos chanos]|uniref:Transmembrane protein 51a n=1 Tax=Chanos chanos TaxID=29144 RepID=A0A6J2WAZ4_CHACN|nr:transmembrane protein 51-like [Chanos chanos]